MPKLWNETIESHRREVRSAILDTTAALVTDHGMLSVTMSEIAQETGIGRATLYKYFPDVASILEAWHERQIEGHLGYLAEVRDAVSGSGEQVAAVLEAYAMVARGSHGHDDTDLARFLHRGQQVSDAQQRVHEMVTGLIEEAAAGGDLRNDIGADELASYCLHAIRAAGELRSKAAVTRLVGVILSGLRPAP